MALKLAYGVRTYSSATAGRSICNARTHHFVADDAAFEYVGPGEYFLSGIAACGVNMMERIAREEKLPVQCMEVMVESYADPKTKHGKVKVYDAIRCRVEMWGVSAKNAKKLVEDWKRLCPLYGSVAVATPDTTVKLVSHTAKRKK